MRIYIRHVRGEYTKIRYTYRARAFHHIYIYNTYLYNGRVIIHARARALNGSEKMERVCAPRVKMPARGFKIGSLSRWETKGLSLSQFVLGGGGRRVKRAHFVVLDALALVCPLCFTGWPVCVCVCVCVYIYIYIKLGREIKRVRSRVKIAGARGGANIARARAFIV